MKLSYLLQPWAPLLSQDCEIMGIQNDSRHVKPGDLFIAYPGAVTDGRHYLSSASEQGACAIVYEPNQWPEHVVLPHSIPCHPIENLASQLAALASRFYAEPSQSLSVMGVTGTNGKTTIAYQLAQAHHLLGRPSAYIGTLGEGCLPDLTPLNNTTPDALCLQRLFSEYQHKGLQQVCMEVSSHALSEHRVDEIMFREAIYTNLSHEHLDYHETMASYANAKALLFGKSSLQWVILNQDDDHVQTMADAVPKTVQQFRYGLHHTSDVRASDCKLYIHGSQFLVDSPWGQQELRIPSLGLFNIYNSLAVYTSLLANGYSMTDVVAIMAKLHASPGRMEVVSQKPYVIVDYAHTPAALENVLKTVVQLKSHQHSKIWVVFGCGGDRDKTKRPLMGRIAGELAQELVLTNDNPRHEDPQTIIQDIQTGISAGTKVTVLLDRHTAIQFALQSADQEDIVVIAGKGHENYQIIGSERLVFSDQTEVRRVLG
ncbi:MAG: UDP-N-acetylmuramoyl-L-alanyl-D-glutamate--2,6-diaminopimelate ligase [Legionella sp.]|nr:MAG: UDP-N-acetylmuramoyl-L-alanyl-D-glutamate--2,6-diaminopimelate ligase [Legionella sp.]